MGFSVNGDAGATFSPAQVASAVGAARPGDIAFAFELRAARGVEDSVEFEMLSGMATGIVTTTRITHATPAATFSHICHRDGENNIAAQVVPGSGQFNAALGSGVDVLLGGGATTRADQSGGARVLPHVLGGAGVEVLAGAGGAEVLAPVHGQRDGVAGVADPLLDRLDAVIARDAE